MRYDKSYSSSQPGFHCKKVFLARSEIFSYVPLGRFHWVLGIEFILKTNLSQFLVTEDYRIVANDLDDLPEVIPDNLPNCTWGKIEDRDPSFQSPEEKSYSPNDPSPFTDKADVWKLVNMTKFIMYKVSNLLP